MIPDAYAMLAERQDVYWWHRARRAMALALLRRFGVPAHCRWLDLGCGPGGNLEMLAPLSPDLTVGVDLSPIAIDHARHRRPAARLVRADITKGLPFASGSFDAVTIFNVLYHSWVGDETAVLREAVRVLRPGGVILITEPAFSVLARAMDVVAMGRRRYRLADIAGVCTAVGLEPLFGSYFTSFGFPLLLGVKMIEWLKGRTKNEAPSGADMKPLKPLLNEGLHGAATIEGQAIARGIAMPLGTTLLYAARRSGRV